MVVKSERVLNVWAFSRRHSFFLLIILAASVYAALAPRFYVGYFGDDARDILAARSLLHGSYSDWQQPSHPPLNFPLPGFPLLLAPWTALLVRALGWLRLIPILSTLGSLFFLRKLFEPHFSTSAAFSACMALFAFNPATLAYSTFVISDASYLFFMAWVLVLYCDEPQPQTGGKKWLLGGALACVALLRPEGMILMLAIFMARLSERHWKSAVVALSLPGIGLGSWFLRNVKATGTISGYSSLWAEAFTFLRAGFWPWFSYEKELGQKLFLDLILGISMPVVGSFQAALASVIVLLVIVVLARGIWRTAHVAEVPRWFLVTSLYTCGHLLLHAVWPAADPHYLWPLLPFLLFFIVQGASRGMLWIMAALYLWQGMYALNAVFQKAATNQLPAKTLAWIATETPKDSYFLAPNASLITLYTGRCALALIRARNAEDFYGQLQHRGITHILVMPPRFLYLHQANGPSPEKAWWRIALTASLTPAKYAALYQDSTEQSLVYRVKK